jgi:hypothetical protein
VLFLLDGVYGVLEMSSGNRVVVFRGGSYGDFGCCGRRVIIGQFASLSTGLLYGKAERQWR